MENFKDKKNDDILEKLVHINRITKDEKELKTGKKVNKNEISKIVAQKLTKKAKEKNITKIYFDRGSYKYHGRVKAFAETLRENGMEF